MPLNFSVMIFINYRRGDTQHLARALAEMLRHRFGPDNVFLDESSIVEGTEWPRAIWKALRRAEVVLSLIGPNWLKCSDKFERRRIDDPNDWVRRELQMSKKQSKVILPVFVGGCSALDREALPKRLKWFPLRQAQVVNDNNWYRDVQSLMDSLVKHPQIGKRELEVPLPVAPAHTKKKQKLTHEQVLEGIQKLKGWEPVKSVYPPRQELRKIYMFQTFERAVAFMTFVTPKINANGHHPRWENQYRSITVYFSTWDAGCLITQHDLAAAALMDEWWKAFKVQDRNGETFLTRGRGATVSALTP